MDSGSSVVTVVLLSPLWVTSEMMTTPTGISLRQRNIWTVG